MDQKAPNSVYVKADKEFCGANLTERRVVDSWIIQAYGKLRSSQCEECVKGEAGKGIYWGCYTLEGAANGACGNCKRGDRATQCGLGLGSQIKADETGAQEGKREDSVADRRTRNAVRNIVKRGPDSGYSVEDPEDIERESVLVELHGGKCISMKVQRS